MLVFSSAYSEYTVISKEYTGPLDFDITGVYCSCITCIPIYYTYMRLRIIDWRNNCQILIIIQILYLSLQLTSENRYQKFTFARLNVCCQFYNSYYPLRSYNILLPEYIA